MKSIGAPIFLSRCPSVSAHEIESMLRTYLVCRGKKEKEREKSKRHVGEEHSVLTTAILLSQRLSCYWGKIVLLRMLANFRVADLRLRTAQQSSTGENLPSDLYPVIWRHSTCSFFSVPLYFCWKNEWFQIFMGCINLFNMHVFPLIFCVLLQRWTKVDCYEIWP
jgi:hypothetical protein